MNLSIEFVFAVKKWIKLKQLDYLGIPLFYGSGLTEFEGRR